MGKSTKGNKGDQTISTIPTSKHLPGDNLSSLPNPQTLPPLPSARLDRFKLYVRHTFNEIKTRKLNYCLGAMSCFIVVSVVALTVSALYQAPVVFLSLSEASTSETDLKISAGTWTGNSHVNYTRIKDQLVQDGNPQFKLHTPRFEFRTPFFKWDSSLGLDPTNSTWMYSGSTATNNAGCNRFPRSWTKNCVYTLLKPLYQSQFFLMDLKNEKDINLGRAWTVNSPTHQSSFLFSLRTSTTQS